MRKFGLLVVSLSVLAVIAVAGNSATAGKTFTEAQKKYWAFQPLKVALPAKPAANPIDAFILDKLEPKKLKLNAEADRVTLLRRVSFDLTGLPPTPGEVDAFVNDASPQAYEKVVDRLLASPHYGERWARHWLDLARFAESEGFKSDETRPNAWRYREYVIRAFNENKPYDRFVKEQIAGDELWPNDPWARVATGFNRHYPDESNARNLMQRRQEILDDVTDTVAATFMAMTYGCARCHDHKFDPILHTDYYRLQAFFANTAADDEIPMISPAEVQQWRERRAVWEAKIEPVRKQMNALLDPEKAKILKEFVDKYPAEIQEIIAKPASQRNPYEWQMFYKAKSYLTIDDDAAAKTLKGEKKTEYQKLLKELAQFDPINPGDEPTGIGVHDVSATAPPTFRLNVGVYDAKAEEVQPGFLSIIDPVTPAIKPPAGLNTSGRRTALANWLASPTNPLTARVMVNRIWHYHFGQGIAPAPSDFGAMGGRPSHPELLDWLASDFVKSGWDIKRMQKQMVMSATYRQSSAFSKEAAAEDPRDRLLWRFPRERLEGEEIRDAALAVAGILNEAVGGPSVFPELPAGAGKPRGGWKTSKDAAERNRRSLYIFVRRNARYPMLEAFDMPDTHESCGRRNQTITAPQAMSMLNGKVPLEWAEAFAGRVLKEAGPDTNAEVETAYRLAFGRKPDGFEKDTVLTFLSKQKSLVAERKAGQKFATPVPAPEAFDPASGAALVDFCQMLLNSNEFVYRN